jgi:hypothetical protein
MVKLVSKKVFNEPRLWRRASRRPPAGHVDRRLRSADTRIWVTWASDVSRAEALHEATIHSITAVRIRRDRRSTPSRRAAFQQPDIPDGAEFLVRESLRLGKLRHRINAAPIQFYQPTNPISTIGCPMSLPVTTVAGLTSPQEFDTSLSLVTRYGRLLQIFLFDPLSN